MVKLDDKHLLMIEPKNKASGEPVKDWATEKMATLLVAAKLSEYGYRGWHTCVCKATSDNREHILPDGTITNSLAVHYLERHRDEVPQGELDKLMRMQLNPPNGTGMTRRVARSDQSCG